MRESFDSNTNTGGACVPWENWPGSRDIVENSLRRGAGRSGQDPLQHRPQGSHGQPRRHVQTKRHLPGCGLHLRTGKGRSAFRRARPARRIRIGPIALHGHAAEAERIGVLETDAHVFGNFTQMGMSPPWQLIEELKKQYEVVPVSPADLAAPRKPGEAGKALRRLAGHPAFGHGPPGDGRFCRRGPRGPADRDLRRPLLLPLLGAGSPRHLPAADAAEPDDGLWPREPGEGRHPRPLAVAGHRFQRRRRQRRIQSRWPVRSPRAARRRSSGSVTTRSPSWATSSSPNSSSSITVAGPRNRSAKRIRSAPNCSTCSSRPRLHRGHAGGGQTADRQVAQPPVRQADRTEDEKALRRFRGRQDASTTTKRSAKWPTAGRRSRKNSTTSPAAAKAEDHPARSDRRRHSLKSLVKDLDLGDAIAPSASCAATCNRFPIRVSGAGISEDESARLADEEPDRLRAEAAKLNKEATGSPAEGRRPSSWRRLPGSRKGCRRPHGCRRHQYAEGVMALQIKDRSFVPLVQTGSEAAGTIPVAGSRTLKTSKAAARGSAPSAPCSISPATINSTSWPRTSKARRAASRGPRRP